MNRTSQLHLLTGAYATGTLPHEEDQAFAAHLGDCKPCALETRELLETTALLGVAAAQPAPKHLRAAVLAEITRTRQLPPTVAVLADHRPRARRRRINLAAAACLATLAIATGSFAWQQHTRDTGTGQRVVALQNAPQSRTATGIGDAGTATVTVWRAQGQMQFTAGHLPALRPGRTYQIWLLTASGTRSAGTFNPEPGRSVTRSFPGPQPGELAVTDEPAGGSTQPTTKPLLQLTLPA